MSSELLNPISRFLVVTVGLTAYVVARTLTGATDFPPYMLWVLIVGSVGGIGLTIYYLISRRDRQPGQSVIFSLIVSAVSFAIVFGITWLLSA